MCLQQDGVVHRLLFGGNSNRCSGRDLGGESFGYGNDSTVLGDGRGRHSIIVDLLVSTANFEGSIVRLHGVARRDLADPGFAHQTPISMCKISLAPCLFRVEIPLWLSEWATFFDELLLSHPSRTPLPNRCAKCAGL